MKNDLKHTSKFLSFVLHHQPDAIGLTLDANGWADLDELIAYAAQDGKKLDLPLLREVVTSNDKQRFTLDEAQGRIRANQGHSVDIDLGLQPVTPPEVLYHGTATRFVAQIRQDGLKPDSRQHVHLSTQPETATNVGERHGKPTILRIKALALHNTGHAFYCSANGVWLTNNVPVAFIEFAV